MKTSMSLFLTAGLSILGTQAWADVVCTASAVINNQELTCSSMQIPDEGAISSSFSCGGGYTIVVDCDLYSRPNKLTLSITGPNGSNASTSTKSKLKLVDGGGNGASISCVQQ